MNLIRGLLFDNLGVKLVALLLAVVVYLHVYTERPANMIVSFPLEFEDLPDSLSLYGPAPRVVQAELKGTGKQLIRLKLTEPRLKVSMAGVVAGRFERPITADDLPLIPSDKIEVKRMVGPGLLVFQLDHKEARRVAVAPRVSGAPKSDAVWSGEVAVEPPTVVIHGPRRSLAHLDSIPLQIVRIDGRRDTVRVQAGPDSLPPWCTVDPPTVAITIPVTRKKPS